MNWREWPQGTEGIDTIINRDICPVCASTLRPVEIYYTSKANWLNPDSTEFYTAICPKCRTQYTRSAPAGTITISPDAENITELEERVRILEETLSRLITFIRQSQVQPKSIPERPTGAKQEKADEFMSKYRYLL